MSADQLTDDTWKCILSHVPQHDRLGSCSLVCSKWHSLAVAATHEASLCHAGSSTPEQQQRHQQLEESMQSFIQKHGRHITSVVFSSSFSTGGKRLVRLPCDKLLHLEASHVSLQLTPDVVNTCRGLTCLSLHDCEILGSPVLAGLSASTGVSLQSSAVRNADVVLSSNLLPALQHLTLLNLFRVDVAIAGFELPASLQALVLCFRAELDPAVLSSCLHLEHLTLVDIRLWGGGASGEALLKAIEKLQQLEVLELRSLKGGVWPDVKSAASGSKFSSLVASTKLHTLDLMDMDDNTGRLPIGFAERAFAGCLRSSVREFGILSLAEWDDACVSSLVSCCPGCEFMHLSALADAASVAALQPATALTYLYLGMHNLRTEIRAGIQAATVLTTLRRLRLNLRVIFESDDDDDDDGVVVVGGDGLRRADFLPLTSLRGLTALESKPKFDFCAEDESAPVCQQLEEWCSQDDFVLPWWMHQQ